MMNIKQVEKLTGISSQNIRFYEKSGLIHPKRNEENGYREYNEEDVRLLKLVKMFRMLDMPIEQIKLMLCEADELDNLLGKQEKALEKKLENTKCAIDLCENLRKRIKQLQTLMLIRISTRWKRCQAIILISGFRIIRMWFNMSTKEPLRLHQMMR